MKNILPLDGMRVLVMEDEFLIAMDIEQICLDHGAAEVVVVRTIDALGPDTFAHSFHAAILDLMLAGRSTVEVAKELSERGTAVVFATGHSDIEKLREAIAGVEIVNKPYSGRALVDAVVRTIQHRHASSGGV